jgi:hypothetical protein
VGEGAGVDDHELGAVGPRGVDAVDQRAFVVALEACSWRRHLLPFCQFRR